MNAPQFTAAKPDALEKPLSARAVASRLNGAKSKGPKTVEGKARSSQNALKYGLTSAREIVTSQDFGDFEIFQASMHQHLAPADALQAALVERIIACAWRLRRLLAVEADMLEKNGRVGKCVRSSFFYDFDERRFISLSRYEAAVERSFYHALQALSMLRSPASNPSRADPPPVLE